MLYYKNEKKNVALFQCSPILQQPIKEVIIYLSLGFDSTQLEYPQCCMTKMNKD